MSTKRRMRVVQARSAFVEDLAREVEWQIHETGKAIYFVSSGEPVDPRRVEKLTDRSS